MTNQPQQVYTGFINGGFNSVSVRQQVGGEQKIYISPLADRLLMLCIPFLLVTAYIIFIFVYLPYEQFLLLGGVMLAYFVPPAGKRV